MEEARQGLNVKEECRKELKEALIDFLERLMAINPDDLSNEEVSLYYQICDIRKRRAEANVHGIMNISIDLSKI